MYPHELALRFARQFANAHEIPLHRFRVVQGSENSDNGKEWYANGRRSSHVVTVWQPSGEQNINDALMTRTCRMYGGRIYAVRISGEKAGTP